MFEFDKFDPRGKPSGTGELASRSLPVVPVQQRTFMAWGEHCIECAAPACYQSCDLYRPRSDGRCRRFAFGMVPRRDPTSPLTDAADIVFKKWAKLETRGNAYLQANWKVRLAERLFGLLSRLLNPLGKLVFKIRGDIRYSYLSYALIERYVRWRRQRFCATSVAPTGFLLEVINPTPTAAGLQISFAIEKKKLLTTIPLSQLPTTYSEKIVVPPGYSSRLIQWEHFSHVAGSGLPFDISITPEAESDTHLIFRTIDMVRLDESPTPESHSPEISHTQLPAIKCVVFDLDGTLWDGGVVEDELVALREEVVSLIKAFDQRGVLLSIASKNSHDHAWSKIQQLGLAEYFLYPKINWQPKSQNIRRIAEELNIDVNTFLFVDDNQFELTEVRQSIPEVECVHVKNTGNLLASSRISAETGGESGQRRKFYQEAMVRDGCKLEYGQDYIGFLKSCQIVLEINPFEESKFERCAELVQRTNQLNFSGRKYDRSALREIIDNSELEKWTLECRDKFGSYGTVGFCICHTLSRSLIIDDLMLSCRVQGKFIELAFFKFLWEREPAVQSMSVNFQPTQRNTPALHVLETLGFSQGPANMLQLTASEKPFSCDFITTHGCCEVSR